MMINNYALILGLMDTLKVKLETSALAIEKQIKDLLVTIWIMLQLVQLLLEY